MDGWVMLTGTFHSALGMGAALLWRSLPTLATLSLFLLLDRIYRGGENGTAGPESWAAASCDASEKG